MQFYGFKCYKETEQSTGRESLDVEQLPWQEDPVHFFSEEEIHEPF